MRIDWLCVDVVTVAAVIDFAYYVRSFTTVSCRSITVDAEYSHSPAFVQLLVCNVFPPYGTVTLIDRN